MKRLLSLLFSISMAIGLYAQEIEQIIDADNFRNENGMLIINFTVPKNDVPVELKYFVKGVIIEPGGEAFSARTLTPVGQHLVPGRHAIYWDVNRDAPGLSVIRNVVITLRLTDESINDLERIRARQQEEEAERIRQQMREEERKRIQDSLARVAANTKRPANTTTTTTTPKSKPDYRKTQFGIMGGIGNAQLELEAENADNFEAEWFNEDAISWHAGVVLRTHLWRWLAVQVGGVYNDHKLALKNKEAVDPDSETSYWEWTYVQIPITGHLYLGKKFNLFGGYYFNYQLDSYWYDAGGENRTKLTEYYPDVERLTAEKTEGVIAGFEFKGKHTALTFSYQMDKTSVWHSDFTDFQGVEWKNGQFTASYSIFF